MSLQTMTGGWRVHPAAEVSERAAIGAGTVIWRNAHVREEAPIGRESTIGAGSVVTRDVPDHALVFGNPARLHGWVCACGRRLSMADEGCRGWCVACEAWTILPAGTVKGALLPVWNS